MSPVPPDKRLSDLQRVRGPVALRPTTRRRHPSLPPARTYAAPGQTRSRPAPSPGSPSRSRARSPAPFWDCPLCSPTSPGPVDESTVSVEVGNGLGSIIKRVPQILFSPSLASFFPRFGRIRSFSAFPVPCLGRRRLIPKRNDLQRQALPLRCSEDSVGLGGSRSFLFQREGGFYFVVGGLRRGARPPRRAEALGEFYGCVRQRRFY